MFIYDSKLCLQYNSIQDGETPLYIASFNGRADTVQRLLAAGASVDLADNGSQSKHIFE